MNRYEFHMEEFCWREAVGLNWSEAGSGEERFPFAE